MENPKKVRKNHGGVRIKRPYFEEDFIFECLRTIQYGAFCCSVQCYVFYSFFSTQVEFG